LWNKSVVCHTAICDALLPPDWSEVGALTLARLEAKAKQTRFRKQIDIRTFAYHVA
jgi:hypothetical protein